MFITNFFRRVKRVASWTRKNRQLLLLLIAILIMLILGGCISGDGNSMLAFAVISGVAGGKHVVDGPLTTDVTREASKGLLLNEVDREIVKIRPMATPLDQISRHAVSKPASSMIVDYHTVDTKPTTAKLAEAWGGSTDVSTDYPRATLRTTNNMIFDTSDTVLVQGVSGYDDAGVETGQDLVLYVLSRDEENGITVMALNGSIVGDHKGCVPAIQRGTNLIRMGRAATELDVMSPLFESLPVKSTNFCQIFKLQVEQSLLQKLSGKAVSWNLSDQEEAALYDMRLGMEKSFLFGVKNRIWDSNKKEYVMTTGGIWNQAGKDFSIEGEITSDVLIEMLREAFTGNAGSKRKVLIGGSGLISQLNKQEVMRVVLSSQSVTKWGIDFTELRSKFGTVLVLLSEVFDEVGMPDAGLIIDPEYITKYTHIPFTTQRLDLKSSGQRNVDAIVLTEASCLVLRYPKAHMRVQCV